MINSVKNNYLNNSSPTFKAKFIPTAEEAKFFWNDYPLLGKYIPQHCFGFQKYYGNERNRFMVVSGCSVCSKLFIYDKVQKTGLLSHVDSIEELMHSIRIIKKAMLRMDMKPENITGGDIKGCSYPLSSSYYKEKLTIVKKFFLKLGVEEKNIYQDTEKQPEFDGGILDLKDGKFYDLNTWIYSYNDFKDLLKVTIDKTLKNDPKTYDKALEQYKVRYGCYPKFRKYYFI